MKQREFIHQYNLNNRPRFNDELFNRTDDKIIEAVTNVILSCQRNSSFLIQVKDISVIDSYDDINHILWAYEDSIINKKKDVDYEAVINDPQPIPTVTTRKTSSSAKKRDNPYEYINLKDSDIKIIKVVYHIGITEKSNGWVEEDLTSFIAIPRLVDKYYFRINGKMFSAMYQIVDASTYNNTASVNSKKQSVVFKTVFSPLRFYRYVDNLIDYNGVAHGCIYYCTHVFAKTVLTMKYLLAKMGYRGAAKFLNIPDVDIITDISVVNENTNYIFETRDNIYVTIPKMIYDSSTVAQSLVYTIKACITHIKDIPYSEIFRGNDIWLKSLGSHFVSKDLTLILSKGKSMLESLEFVYDLGTKKDLMLSDYDKEDIYTIIRWVLYQFNDLRLKENVDISTKKVDYCNYIAALLASKIFKGICTLSDKGDRAELKNIKQAIRVSPVYLLNAISNCQLVTYNDCVNDNDAIVALKYTYKGVSGIGEKSNAIPSSYRLIHPSHLGKVDLDSSSASDPGVSGTLCPLSNFHDGRFMDFKEPSNWLESTNKVLDEYRKMVNRKEMVRFISDHSLSTKQNNDKNVMQECISINRTLMDFNLINDQSTEVINGFDILGDGHFFITEE